MAVIRTTLLATLLAATPLGVMAALGEDTHPDVSIDHIVYGAPDLAAASDSIAKKLGVVLTPGGRHPGRGTENALLSPGTGQYLEIIAPDSSLSEPRGAGARLAQLDAPEVLTFAVQTTELEKLDAKARSLGLKTSGIRPGSRRTPGGDLLKWRTLGVAAPRKYAGLMPFFIDWQDTPHPGQTSAQGARLVRMIVAHPDPDGLQTLYRDFGIGVPVRKDERPSITIDIESDDAELRLQGSGRGLR